MAVISLLTTTNRVDDLALARLLVRRGHACTVDVIAVENTPAYEQEVRHLASQARSRASEDGCESFDLGGVALKLWGRRAPPSLDPLTLHDGLRAWVLDGLRLALRRRQPDAVVLPSGGRLLAHLGRDALAELHPRTLMLIGSDDEIPQTVGPTMDTRRTRVHRGAVSTSLAARVKGMTGQDCLVLSRLASAPALRSFECWIEEGAEDVRRWRTRVRPTLGPAGVTALTDVRRSGQHGA